MTRTLGFQSRLSLEHTDQLLRGLSDQTRSDVLGRLLDYIVQQQKFIDALRSITERTGGDHWINNRTVAESLEGAALFFPSLRSTGISSGVWESHHSAFADTSDDHSVDVILSEILGAQSPSHDHHQHALPVIVTGAGESTHMALVSDSSADPSDGERLALLRHAAREGAAPVDPSREFEVAITNQAIELLGGTRVLGRTIRREEELVAALVAGLPGAALVALQEAGYPHKVLEQVVAPKRTLMRRRGEGERLTRSESDAVWRLAYALAMASAVLNGRKAALAWLMRPKAAFSHATPIDLLETSVGAEQVSRLLRQLEWGNVA